LSRRTHRIQGTEKYSIFLFLTNELLFSQYLHAEHEMHPTWVHSRAQRMQNGSPKREHTHVGCGWYVQNGDKQQNPPKGFCCSSPADFYFYLVSINIKWLNNKKPTIVGLGTTAHSLPWLRHASRPVVPLVVCGIHGPTAQGGGGLAKGGTSALLSRNEQKNPPEGMGFLFDAGRFLFSDN
jgi:hypothetical protein